MNTLKPLLIAAVLAGIGYGVYVRINGGNNAPPPGAPQSWDVAPRVELGDGGGPGMAPSWPAPASPPGASPAIIGSGSITPPPSVSGVDAPSPNPPANIAPVNMAPPYSAAPPGAAGQAANGSAPPANPGAGAVQPNSSAAPSDPLATSPPPNAPDSPTAYNSGPPDSGNGLPDRYRTPDNDPSAQAAPSGQGGAAAAIVAARRELESGQLAAALQKLSTWYDDPRLPPPDQQQLNQLLDQVAGTVVYSTQHLLEPPYEVQPNERLEDIAQKYSVPWELLAKINGIDDPASLRPGERLKVVRGPFSAIVSLDKRQLTLVLADGSYAGRFNVGLGREHPPREGVFAVSDKVVNPVYHGPDRAVAAGDQTNPLGQRWIGLGSDLGIHGTDRPENVGRTDLCGSISLSPRDAADVFDILSVGSKVVIRR